MDTQGIAIGVVSLLTLGLLAEQGPVSSGVWQQTSPRSPARVADRAVAATSSSEQDPSGIRVEVRGGQSSWQPVDVPVPARLRGVRGSGLAAGTIVPIEPQMAEASGLPILPALDEVRITHPERSDTRTERTFPTIFLVLEHTGAPARTSVYFVPHVSVHHDGDGHRLGMSTALLSRDSLRSTIAKVASLGRMQGKPGRVLAGVGVSEGPERLHLYLVELVPEDQ